MREDMLHLKSKVPVVPYAALLVSVPTLRTRLTVLKQQEPKRFHSISRTCL